MQDFYNYAVSSLKYYFTAVKGVKQGRAKMLFCV